MTDSASWQYSAANFDVPTMTLRALLINIAALLIPCSVIAARTNTIAR